MSDEDLVLRLRAEIARIQAERDADQEQLYALQVEVAKSRERLLRMGKDNDSLRRLVESDHYAKDGMMCVRPRRGAEPQLGLYGDHAFLAMPFGPSWAPAVEDAVTRALQKNGMRCQRADRLSGRDVMDGVWRSICECGLVVADVTGGSANVLYELGLADVLGKWTLLICQTADAERLPFDLLGQRLTLYSTADGKLDELTESLSRKIRADAPQAPGGTRHG